MTTLQFDRRVAHSAFKPIKPGSYAWTSPYRRIWLQYYYSFYFCDLFDGKIRQEAELKEKLLTHEFLPEIMLMGNFINDRAPIISLCRQSGINLVHCEDGFFPHYSTMHVDPMGFCWESSLPGLVFRRCTDAQRRRAQLAREQWLAFHHEALPNTVRKPFALWPLQLRRDKVNQWDLRVNEWTNMIRHFRQALPSDIQLVIKEHPLGNADDMLGLSELVNELPNTVLVLSKTTLKTLLAECSAVAGANSTVLYEARLMFHKPVYVYAKGWFTNHIDLFQPLYSHKRRHLGRIEWIENHETMRNEWLDDYTDWFLAQMLARQIERDIGLDASLLKRQVERLSYRSFIAYGEDIFNDSIVCSDPANGQQSTNCLGAAPTGPALEIPEPQIVRISVADNDAYNGAIVNTKSGALIFYVKQPCCRCVFLDEVLKPIPGTGLKKTNLWKNDDPRLFYHDNCLFLSTSYRGDGLSREKLELWQVTIENFNVELEVVARFDTILNDPAYVRRREKNWAPFSHESSIYYVHKAKPHRILQYIPDSKAVALVHEEKWKFPAFWQSHWGSEPRLNAPPHRLSDGRFLSTFHTFQRCGYHTWFYTFSGSPPFGVLEISRCPVLRPEHAIGPGPRNGRGPCVFVNGMLVDEQNDSVSLTGGNNDAFIVLVRFKLTEVLASLAPLDSTR